MAFEDVKDARIKKLAETLRQSGMASSDTEAIRMAEEMSSTESKVQKSFDYQHDEAASTDLKDATSRVVKEEEVEEPKPLPKTEESPEIAEEDKPGSLPGQFDQEEVFKEQEDVIKSSFGGDVDPDASVKDLMKEDAEEVYKTGDSEEESITPIEPEEKEEITISEPKPVNGPVSDPQHPKPMAAENLSNGDSVYDPEDPNGVDKISIDDPTYDPEEPAPHELRKISTDIEKNEELKEVEKKTESKDSESQSKTEKSEEEKKKDIEDMSESKVDLGKVFNTGKK
ncbi:hypothetical protein HQ533_05260 [Candidatus Woesearchaeota archaeon]|nr:hypothetical protein [Candidatus Woesearchaeota archaeon]